MRTSVKHRLIPVVCRAVAMTALLGLGLAPCRGHAQTNAQTAPTLRLRSFTVVVRDYDEAKAWYVDKLGFGTLVDQQFGPQRFVLVAPPGQNDVGIVLEKARRDDPSMPADYTDRLGKEVNIVLVTSDLGRLSDTLRKRGVHFRQEPKKQPWGGEAIIEDLYGNSIVLVGPIKSDGT